MLDIWIDMIICIFYLLFFTTPYIVGDILQLKFIRQKLCEKPVLLPQKDYEEAGNYAIRKMQLSMYFSNFRWDNFCWLGLFWFDAFRRFDALFKPF
ncbi:hypothetical protein BTM415_13820 [Helicobacter pylori]